MALNINGTTGISGVEGSVSAPVLTGTDSNCGISFPAADTIKFSTNGVERLSITNSGLSGDGSGLTGVSAGKLLKHQHNEFTNTVATSGHYPQNIFSWTFTPTSASSTILMFMSAPILLYSAGTQSYRDGEYAIWHDETTELTSSYMVRSDNPASAGSLTTNGTLHAKHASHNTTSAITYRIRAGYFYATTSVYFNDESSNSNPHTSIITLEVA